MRVLLLTENWPPQRGGIQNYLQHIAESLPKGSVDVFVPLSADASLESRQNIFPGRFFYRGIWPSWLPLLWRLWKHVRKHKTDVFLCGKALFEGLIGYALFRLCGIPYVVFTYAMEIDTWRAQPLRSFLLRRVLMSAARVVYINDETKSELLLLGASEDQLVKIWPGVDDAFFALSEDDAKSLVLKSYNVSQPFVISVGRLISRKGYDTLLKAFALISKKYPKLSLVVVGDGPERQSLEDLSQELGLNEKVRFLISVSDVDLVPLYASAEFFVLSPRQEPTDREGFGIVFLEAAAQGLATIGTKTGGIPEAIEEGVTGLLVEPEDPDALAEAMRKLFSEPDFRERLGSAGQQRAIREFRWRKRILLVKGMIDAILYEQAHKS